jgi:hypothetical protein
MSTTISPRTMYTAALRTYGLGSERKPISSSISPADQRRDECDEAMLRDLQRRQGRDAPAEA